MRLILTSDTQTDFHNLDLCEIAMQEVLASAKKYKPDAIVHCGDAKEAYNPLDTRVVQFWVRWTRIFVKTGFRFIVLKGNHDRISQSHESKNWLDILRAAGAETVSLPKVKTIGRIPVAFLPYTGDKAQEKKWAKELAATEAEVLFFHTEIRGGTLNSAGQVTIGYDPNELEMGRYAACFGGHIHRHQRIGSNVWYVGSPFCQDWSEANDPKGHLIVNYDSGLGDIEQIETSIPGWFDAEYLESHNIKPQDGAYIRSRVPVTSKKLTQQLKDEEERLRRVYPLVKNLRFYVIPKLEQSEEQEIKLEGLSDADKVQAYVSATWPDDAKSSISAAVPYLTSKLLKVAPATRYGAPLRFLSGQGTNFLSFKSLQMKYHKQGLVLLQGENRDWPNQQNASGKTNALSLLPVVLWGETLKGQKNDAWINERIEGVASGSLKMRDGRGRLIEVTRGRPHSLGLVIDGVDQSTGLTGKGRDQTQGKIEEVIGYDKKMFLNAVYIDQTIANGFVFGTQSERMNLIGKIQNLERFDDALKLVTKDIEKNNNTRIELETNISNHESGIVNLEADIEELKAEAVTNWQERQKQAQKDVAHLMRVKSGLAESKDLNDLTQREYDDWASTEQMWGERLVTIEGKIASLKTRQNQADKFIAEKKCPRCGQPSIGVGKRLRHGLGDLLQAAVEDKAKVQKILTNCVKEMRKRSTTLQQYVMDVERVDRELKAAREILKQAEQGAIEEVERNNKVIERRRALQGKLQRMKRVLKACRSVLRELDKQREIMEYAKKAFHRSGMPLYLAASLCPVLNKAAEEYSEIFFHGKIKLRFVVEDGKFIVVPVNPAGSQEIDGQSGGESAMAGIVAAFAVREISPRTNLLVMDEPGTGLDSEGAKSFARGLLKLKERFSTIIITTHHPSIISILSGEVIWRVIKHRGISELSIS